MAKGPTTVNPFNDKLTVRLLDEAGAEVALISQREAARLLRAGHAKLLLELPPAVRLDIGTADYQAFRDAPPDQAALKAQFLHARCGALYGNVHFQGPHGETMFHGDSEKALWYLNRGLVDVVSHAPPVLRFRFSPGGKGHIGDDYYLAGKANRCVVCGSEEGLSRHHVVPSVYRRHLPAEVKDHSHHDVLLLCLGCHERYEGEANRLKAELGTEFGMPLHGLRGERDRARGRAISLAQALRRHPGRIPAARQDEMRRIIGAWLGKSPVDDADIEAVALLECDEDGVAVEHGRQVVEQSGDVEAFVRRWREHFLRTMNPAYLPDHWDAARPARREKEAPGQPLAPTE